MKTTTKKPEGAPDLDMTMPVQFENGIEVKRILCTDANGECPIVVESPTGVHCCNTTAHNPLVNIYPEPPEGMRLKYEGLDGLKGRPEQGFFICNEFMKTWEYYPAGKRAFLVGDSHYISIHPIEKEETKVERVTRLLREGLPDDLAEAAISQIDEEYVNIRYESKHLSGAIDNFRDWSRTKEGPEFWEFVYRQSREESPNYPSLPAKHYTAETFPCKYFWIRKAGDVGRWSLNTGSSGIFITRGRRIMWQNLHEYEVAGTDGVWVKATPNHEES